MKKKQPFSFVPANTALIALIAATSKSIKINSGFREMPDSSVKETKFCGRSI